MVNFIVTDDVSDEAVTSPTVEKAAVPRDITYTTISAGAKVMVAGNCTKENMGSESTSAVKNSTLPIKSSTAIQHPTSSYSGANDAANGEKMEVSDYEPSRSARQTETNSLQGPTLGINQPGISAPDDTKLVAVSLPDPRRTQDNFCLYCKTFQKNISRHLLGVHSEEEDVKKFANLPPKTKERLNMIATIRKAGNHLFNTDNRFNDGRLLVCRRPPVESPKTAMDFVPCGQCKGQYSRSVIQRHEIECMKNKKKDEPTAMVEGREIAARNQDKASFPVRALIFPYMREDVVRGIRYDELVVMYANKQCENSGSPDPDHYQTIRAQLQLLGRLLEEMKKRNASIKNLADVFQPQHFDEAVKAVNILAGFNERKLIFSQPAVASSLDVLLKNVGELLRSEFIKTEEKLKQKRVEDFLKLYREEHAQILNRAVGEALIQNVRRKAIKTLPITNYTQTLHEFVKTERDAAYSSLREHFSISQWKKLAETSLLSLELFNRRQPGETERVLVEDFAAFRGIDGHTRKEIIKSLPKGGKNKWAQEFVRFEISGKLGRRVGLLADTNLLDCLLLMVLFREKAGVPADNGHLFGMPSIDQNRVQYLRASSLMREYAAQCGATVVETPPNVMSRNEKTPEDIYQSVVFTHIVKVSRVLEIASGLNEPPMKDSRKDYQTNEPAPNVEQLSEDNTTVETKQELMEEHYTQAGNVEQLSEDNTTVGIKQELTEEYYTGASTPNKRKRRNRRWTEEESYVTLKAFKNNLIKGSMPSELEIQNFIDKNVCLKGRTVNQLRSWLYIKKTKMLDNKIFF